MKTIFIEHRYDSHLDINKGDLLRLPGKVAVLATVQYLSMAESVKEMMGKKATLPKLKHSAHRGQVLGCSIEEIKGVDSILFVGDGLFHPIALAIKNKTPIFILDPYEGKIRTLDKSDVERYEKRRKGALLKYLHGKNIGILISTKPGQRKDELALELKKRAEAEGKSAYLFLFDTLDQSELLNFPFIDCYVNTACPRLAYDDYLPRPVINHEDLIGSEK